LYDQLGGGEGIHAITERMIDRFAQDPRVLPLFAHIDIPRFSSHFSEFICQVADGPCHYRGDSMAEVHRGMNINEAQFNAVVQDLIAAMDAQQVPVRVQNRLIARLAAMQQSIVYQ
jgi:hemoglobin